ncbi:MAG: LamG-like jellyroll fold domain-containing protein, partial [Bacteroidota bacterium]
MGTIFSQNGLNGDHILLGSSQANPDAEGDQHIPLHMFSNDALELRPRGINPFLDVENGEWHHIVVCWEQNQLGGFRSYVDGVLIQVGDTVNRTLPLVRTEMDGQSQTAPVMIGSETIGELAEMRLWTVARSHGAILKDAKRVLEVKENEVTHPGLLAYWRMDDAEGAEIKDWAPKESNTTKALLQNISPIPPYDGVATGAEAVTDPGLYLMESLGEPTLNALVFDGIDDFAFVEDMPGIEFNRNFTAEVAFKMPCNGPLFSRLITNEQAVIDRRSRWKGLFVRDNRLFFNYRTSSSSQGYREIGGIELPMEGWVYAALTVNAIDLSARFYINGRPAQEGMSNLRSTFRRSDATPQGSDLPITSLAIGMGRMDRNHESPLAYFSGQIGEIRFWNSVRSAEQVANNFRKALRPSEAGLEGLWRFTAGEGTVVSNLKPEEATGAKLFGPSWIPESGFELDGFGNVSAQGLLDKSGSLGPRCLQLEGGESRLDVGLVPDLELLGNMTLEAWVCPDAVNGEQVIISKGRGGAFELVLIDDKLNYYHGGNFREEFQFDFVAGQWHHIALVREDAVKFIRCYINGLLVNADVFDVNNGVETVRNADTQDKLYTGQLPLKTTDRLTIGNNPAGNTGLAGRIMEVRIWDHPRRPDRIRLLRGQRLRGFERGMLAYFPMSFDGNDLDAGDTKRVSITSKVAAGTNISGVTFSATAVD